jgi:hypothetical protein
MLCVILSHQELSGNPQYAVIAPECVKLRTPVHFVHTEQKIISTTPQHNHKHNRKHNHTPCPTAPSAHASYKGYGFNYAKPPRPPHRNTMINVVLLGCGPIRTGEGAVAQFIGVHILGKIWPAGGLIPWPNRDGRTELDHLSRSKKSTIPQSTVRGLFMSGELAVGRNGGPVCGDGN